MIIKLLETKAITSENLSTYLPQITWTKPPKSGHIYWRGYYCSILERMKWSDKDKKMFKMSVLEYLIRYTYHDTYNTNHVARAKDCIELCNSKDELDRLVHGVYSENSLHFCNNITSVIDIGTRMDEKYNNKNAFVQLQMYKEDIGSKGAFETSEFDEKEKTRDKVSNLSLYLCGTLLRP